MTSRERALREQFTAELEQLRLQVEVMALRVEENLARMRQGLVDGDDVRDVVAVSEQVIDDLNISLTERCYVVLVREAPVASDLRLVVSVIRVLTEFERIADHAMTVARAAPEVHERTSVTPVLDLLVSMADEVVERFSSARRAWGAMDLRLAEELATGSVVAEALHTRLVRELLRLEGPDAVAVALAAAGVGRSLERICDHTTVIGARVRYLITGDPAHLAAEVR